MANKEMIFRINGEFITRLARERTYYEGDMEHGIELLLSCMAGTDLSDNELLGMALAILDGRAELKGTYPDDDYGFVWLEERNQEYNLAKLMDKITAEKESIKKEYDALQERYLAVWDGLSGLEQSRIQRMLYAEGLSDEAPAACSLGDALLDSFVKRMTTESEDDYGWLDPQGTFYPVEWGEHQVWADRYVEEQSDLPEERIHDLQVLGTCGDYLIEMGWVLLHNPSQGVAFPTKDPFKEYTKAQKEFLYDYYMERDCQKEAMAIWQ